MDLFDSATEVRLNPMLNEVRIVEVRAPYLCPQQTEKEISIGTVLENAVGDKRGGLSTKPDDRSHGSYSAEQLKA